MYGQNDVLESKLADVTLSITILTKFIKLGGRHTMCIYDLLCPLRQEREELLRDLRVGRDINRGGEYVRNI